MSNSPKSGKGVIRQAENIGKKVVLGTMKQFGVGAVNVPPLLSQFSSPNMNVAMTIKSCVPRAANVVSQLGVYEGYMTKRNEQNRWQRRYCVLVPHLFLYYYEHEESESPRGIIDLEYYTNVQLDDEGVIHLAPSYDIPLRTFHFKVDGQDENEANAWIAALHRERHQVIKEERDAYKDLQDMFSNTMNQTTETIAASDKEKEQAMGQLAAEQQMVSQYCAQIQHLLEDLGLNPELTGSYEDMGEALSKLKELVLDYTKPPQEDLAAKRREEALIKEVGELREKAQMDSSLLNQLKANVFQLKNEVAALKEDKKALEAAVGEHEVNLSIVAGERQAADQKITELTEQKKLLIREVKLTRKALADARSTNERLASSYQTLEGMIKERKLATDAGSSPALPNPSPVLPNSGSQSRQESWDGESKDSNSDSVAGLDAANQLDTTANVTDKSPNQELNPDDRKPQREQSSSNLGYRMSRLFSKTKSSNQLTEQKDDISESGTPTTKPSLSGFASLGEKFNRSKQKSPSRSRSEPTISLDDEEPEQAQKDSVEKTPEEEGRFVLRCKRCKGTVEGPVFSTCKCLEPQLEDDDDDRPSLWSKMNFSFQKKAQNKPKISMEALNSVEEEMLQEDSTTDS